MTEPLFYTDSYLRQFTTTVAQSVRAEPVIATLLAIPVLGETPSWVVLPGGLLLLAGVYLALRASVPSPSPSRGV